MSRKTKFRNAEIMVSPPAKMIKMCGKTLCLGDRVVVKYRCGGTIEGKIIELWSKELDNHLQARIDSGWCFHDHDEIRKHIKIEDQLATIPINEETKP